MIVTEMELHANHGRHGGERLSYELSPIKYDTNSSVKL